MNYGTLKTSVANYLHRSDLTAVIPDFIDQARTRIGGDLRALANQVAANVTSFSGGRAALPANWSAAISVVLDDVPLTFLPIEHIGPYSRGVFSVSDGDLVVPEAGSTATVVVNYYAIPTAFSADPDVGIGMLEWPQLWIYASVAEGALYIQEMELMARMNEAYVALIGVANRAGTEALYPPGVAVVNDQPATQGMAVL